MKLSLAHLVSTIFTLQNFLNLNIGNTPFHSSSWQEYLQTSSFFLHLFQLFRCPTYLVKNEWAIIYCLNLAKFQMEIQKNSPLGWHSSDYTELGHFKCCFAEDCEWKLLWMKITNFERHSPKWQVLSKFSFQP